MFLYLSPFSFISSRIASESIRPVDGENPFLKRDRVASRRGDVSSEKESPVNALTEFPISCPTASCTGAVFLPIKGLASIRATVCFPLTSRSNRSLRL